MKDKRKIFIIQKDMERTVELTGLNMERLYGSCAICPINIYTKIFKDKANGCCAEKASAYCERMGLKIKEDLIDNTNSVICSSFESWFYNLKCGRMVKI